MSGNRTFSDETKAEILKQIGQGNKVADVAQVYGVSAANIYYWLQQERNKSDTPPPAPLPRTNTTAISTFVPPSQMAIEEQIEVLSKDFVGKLKGLLVKQIMNNLKAL